VPNLRDLKAEAIVVHPVSSVGVARGADQVAAVREIGQ
jgi:hypothetical protein